MPKFIISKAGQALQTLTLEGERIELGSARTCQLFIDDLLISLHQMAFLKTPEGYRVEPVSRTPSFNVNGRPADGPLALAPGDSVEIEGYQIQIDFDLPAGLRPPPKPSTPQPLVHFDASSDGEKTEFHVRPLGQMTIIAGPLKGMVRPLVPGEIRIGRDQSQNEIVIRNDSKGEIDRSISRRHASIHVEGNNIFVEDLQSTAGTFVNGRQAPPKQRVTLKSGDQIEIRSAKESTIIHVEIGLPGALESPPPPLSGPAPLPPLSEVLPPPLSAPPLPPPLAATPPPLTPPPREARPTWTPPPPPPPPPAPEPRDERADRPSRVRPRATFDDNPFQQVEDVSWYSTLPLWTWFVAGAAVIILVVCLMLICR